MILDTPDAIARYQLAVIKGRLKLEIKGMKFSRGETAYAAAKRLYGVKGSREKVLAQLQDMIDGKAPLPERCRPPR